MKANKLMVGDILRVNRDGLCIKKDTAIRVLGIDGESKLKEKGLVGYAGCRPLEKNQFDGGIWLDYLDPIPLTPEILEKNGFKMAKWKEDEPAGLLGKWWDNRGQVLVKRFDFTLLREVYSVKANNSRISNIRYVHELQHALRICGIDKEITI